MTNEIRVFGDRDELAAAATEHIVAAATRAVAERGRFLLVLSGGTTPRDSYERLASRGAGRIDWGRVHVFWSDERCVASDHPQSNYGMAATSFLRRVGLPPGNVHRIPCEEPLERAASLYDRELAEFFRAATPAVLGPEHAFDLVLLGVGDDGHTASLFAGSPALAAPGWTATARAPASAAVPERVTLTLPAINSSRVCLFLVAGAAKRRAIQKVLRAPAGAGDGGSFLPAARVRPRGRRLWFLDAEAAGKAPPGEPEPGSTP